MNLKLSFRKAWMVKPSVVIPLKKSLSFLFEGTVSVAILTKGSRDSLDLLRNELIVKLRNS